MEVAKQYPSRKTSTWPTVPSPLQMSPRSPASTSSVCPLPASTSPQRPAPGVPADRIGPPVHTCCGAMGTPGHGQSSPDPHPLRAPTHHPAAAYPPLHLHRVFPVLAGRHQYRGTAPRARLSRTALDWALRALVVDHLSVNRVAGILEVCPAPCLIEGG